MTTYKRSSNGQFSSVMDIANPPNDNFYANSDMQVLNITFHECRITI